MSHQSALQIDIQIIRKGKSVVRAINHPLRHQMIALIHKNRRMMVTDIYKELKMEQSVASMHLGILRMAGFVNYEREGKYVFYFVNYKRIKEVHLHIAHLLKQVAVK